MKWISFYVRGENFALSTAVSEVSAIDSPQVNVAVEN
jgi:hypothetical protein